MNEEPLPFHHRRGCGFVFGRQTVPDWILGLSREKGPGRRVCGRPFSARGPGETINAAQEAALRLSCCRQTDFRQWELLPPGRAAEFSFLWMSGGRSGFWGLDNICFVYKHSSRVSGTQRGPEWLPREHLVPLPATGSPPRPVLFPQTALFPTRLCERL